MKDANGNPVSPDAPVPFVLAGVGRIYVKRRDMSVEREAIAMANSWGVDWDAASESYKASMRHQARELLTPIPCGECDFCVCVEDSNAAE